MMPETTPVSVAALLANLPQRICDVIKPWCDRMPEQPALVEASALGPIGSSQLPLPIRSAGFSTQAFAPAIGS